MKTKLVYLIGAVTLAIGIAGLLLATLSVNASPSTALSTTWTDNFDGSSLNSRWSWIREDATHWNLNTRPGFLRIMTQKGALLGSSNNAMNLLVQNAPVGEFEIQTHLIFTPTQNFQIAGLLAYQNDDNFLMLGRAYCGYIPPCVGNGIYFDHEEQGTSIGNNFITTTVLGEAYLRLVRHGTVYTGYVSENGADWTMVGARTVVSGLIPSKVGLAAFNQTQDAAEIPADFDFFWLDDSSHRVFLPLILR